MTKERKASPTWYIAATHFLTAGFLIPFLANIVVGFAVDWTVAGTATVLVSFIVSVLAVWFGVRYSARYLEKTYLIPDASKVIKMALGYYIVLYVLSMIVLFATASDVINWEETLLQGIIWLVSAAVFYVASKKFVKGTSSF